MKSHPKLITIEEGGLIKLSQDVLDRLNVDIGDYLNVEEIGYRHLRFTKAESPEQIIAHI